MKRETLANYLKKSENPLKNKLNSKNARNLPNPSRNGGEEMVRQSSKTSMTSQMSGTKQRRTGSSGALATSSTPQRASIQVTGKQIRRLGQSGSGLPSSA